MLTQESLPQEGKIIMWTYIYLTISLLHPQLSSTTVGSYADAIVKQAETTYVDPYMIVSIIEHESRFDHNAISEDTLDVGLMQVRSMYYGGKRDWLFNGLTNIKAGGYVIKKSIDFCRGFLKREPTTQEWLSVYQGSIPSCKSNKLTKQVEDYMFCLRSDLTQAKTCHF